MCTECDALVDEAERIVLLAEAERLVILEEARQGVSIPDARRPLFTHEVRARVRFGDMNDALSQAERLNTAHISKAADALVDELLNFIPANASPAEAGAAIGKVMMNPPESVQAILTGLEDNITQVLASVRVFGHDAVVQEATEQGIEFSGLAGDGYLKGALGWARGAASAVATSLWTTIVGRTNTAVVNTYEVARPAVKKEVLDPGLKKPIDDARQLTHDQHNGGRKDGAAEVPDPPARIYAGELLDGNTCRPCNDIDGYVFESEEEAEQWYPQGGPMRNCLGGNRCRGTLIYDWSDLGEEFDGGVDKATPPRLPYVDPSRPNSSGMPMPPGARKDRSPLPEDMGKEVRDEFEKYYAETPAVFTKSDADVLFDGTYAVRSDRVTIPKGGHGAGSSLVNKTKLPSSWSKDDFRRAVEYTILDPEAVGKFGDTWALFKLINGILFEVRVMYGEGGEIKVMKAMPVSGSGIMKTLKNGDVVPVSGVRFPENLAGKLYYNNDIFGGE